MIVIFALLLLAEDLKGPDILKFVIFQCENVPIGHLFFCVLFVTELF